MTRQKKKLEFEKIVTKEDYDWQCEDLGLLHLAMFFFGIFTAWAIAGGLIENNYVVYTSVAALILLFILTCRSKRKVTWRQV